MRFPTRYIGPGVFLILLGAIPLAVRQGALEPGDLAWTWRLWPLFLVFAGLGLLLRRTRLREAGGVLAAILGGTILGSLLAGGVGDLGGIACSPTTDDGTAFPATSGAFATPGTARLTLDCGEAAIVARPGDEWTLSGRSADGAAPTVRTLGDLVSVRSPRSVAPGLAGGWWRIDLAVPAATEAYDVTLNAGALTVTAGTGGRELVGTVNAGSLVADLSDASGLEALQLTVNAGSAALTLPDASVHGSLTVNAGAVSLCVPDGVGLRLTAKRGGLGGNDYADRGLTESAGVWTSPGWEAAAHLIDLETTANAGGFSLNPEDGCR